MPAELRTRDEWLKTLDWREGKAPRDVYCGVECGYFPGIVVEFQGGTVAIVGDMNAIGGLCDCCCDDRPGDEIRWAPLYRSNAE